LFWQSLLQHSPLEVHALPSEKHAPPSPPSGPLPLSTGAVPSEPELELGPSDPELDPSPFGDVSLSAPSPFPMPPSLPGAVLLVPPHAAKLAATPQKPNSARAPTDKAFCKRMSSSICPEMPCDHVRGWLTRGRVRATRKSRHLGHVRTIHGNCRAARTEIQKRRQPTTLT
jgi:hypothetical protein